MIKEKSQISSESSVWVLWEANTKTELAEQNNLLREMPMNAKKGKEQG